jgi:hypothetical protein
MTVIDVHTHMLTREYLDLLGKYGAPLYQRPVNQAGNVYCGDAETSLNAARQQGFEAPAKRIRGGNARALFNL